jgi:hypothetical protein
MAGVREVLETRAHIPTGWYPGKGMDDFMRPIKKFFGGTMELDPQELMTAYTQWKGWQDKGKDMSPDKFLEFLTAPKGYGRRFEKNARPAKGAAEEFKMRYNVEDDVGKAQMQLRR